MTLKSSDLKISAPDDDDAQVRATSDGTCWIR